MPTITTASLLPVCFSMLGQHLHSWLDPLFWTGSCKKGSLEQSDLYAHPGEADSEKLLNKFNRYKTETSNNSCILLRGLPYFF